MRALLIPTSGHVELIDVPGGSGKLFPALYGILDCTQIEALGIQGRPDATMYCDEESRMVNREVCANCGADWKPEKYESGAENCSNCGVMPLPRPTTWVEGRPENEIASELVYGPAMQARERIRDDMALAGEHEYDFVIDATGGGRPNVLGPVVVCGFNARTGKTLKVPDDLASSLAVKEEA